MNSRLRRLLPVLATWALLSACGGEEPGKVDAKRPGTATADAVDSRIVIHMTGVAMIVPPKQGKNSARVLLPPVSAPAHSARLGFGMNHDNPDAAVLCLEPRMVRRHGICYVDLVTWAVDTIGRGGTPAPQTLELPRGVINVTRLAGGSHRVRSSTPYPEIFFASGRSGPNYCTLANWTYEPRAPEGHALPAETEALVNVLEWHITGLSEPTLTFRRTNPATVISVRLVEPPNGRIELILANIPTPDYANLPPGVETQIKPVQDPLAHVHPYYDMLTDPAGQAPGNGRRPVPHTPEPIKETPCPVAITAGTTANLRRAHRVEEQRAIATYACVVGTGS